MNFIGLNTKTVNATEPAAPWVESISPEQLQPRDLHAAQLARRMASQSKRKP
jgi:hypothetical protein